MECADRTAQLYENYKGVLKNAVEGQVVTRFPPEPSGYLHIGHIKAAMLNYHYSKMYKGKMILRFDDTNPVKETQEFVDNILKDLENLEIFPDVQTHTSDYFAQILEMCEKLISEGKAYMDNTSVEEMRRQRNEGIESLCRNTSVEENLAIWKEFIQGNQPDYCVRGKISVDDKNKCMRDPVFYRFTDAKHIRTGDAFKVYPTYDFACPIVDSLEGVTHCLRSSEFNDRNPMYHWILKALDMRDLEIFDYSRLNLVNTVLSKRKLQKLVDTGVVEGWFDPRFPTVQGILRRGLQVQTLKEFMLEQGPSRNTVLMDWSVLWSKNKQLIDPIAPRYTAISSENFCLVELTNGPEEHYQEEHPLHQKNSDLGNTKVTFYKQVLVEYDDAKNIQAGEKVTFMKWGNAVIDSIGTETSEVFKGQPVKLKLTGRLTLEDKDFKKTKKLTWLSAVEELLSPLNLIEFDVLITKAKVEETDNFDELINHNSKFETKAFGSPDLRNLAPNSVFQLERRGFYIIDSQSETSVNMIFIPDGKTKGMSSLGSKVDPKSTAQGSEQKLSKKQQARAAKKAKKQQAKEESKKEE